MRKPRPYKPKCKVCLITLRDDGTCLAKCDPKLRRPANRAGRVTAARKEDDNVSAVL